MTTDKNSETPKRKRMKRERKLRRDLIINAAEKSFIELGYDETMIDQVAKDAGYTKPTIYNYFESKEDLFVGVMTRIYENLFEILNEEVNGADPEKGLRMMGDAYLSFVEKYPGQAALFDSGRIGPAISTIIHKEDSNLQLTDSEKEFRESQLKVERLMTEIIKQTLEVSGVSEHVEPMSIIMALRSLNSAIRELISRSRVGGYSENQIKEYLSVLFNIIDKGLKHYDK
jgi:AcrR family transcriptional regulator